MIFSIVVSRHSKVKPKQEKKYCYKTYRIYQVKLTPDKQPFLIYIFLYGVEKYIPPTKRRRRFFFIKNLFWWFCIFFSKIAPTLLLGLSNSKKQKGWLEWFPFLDTLLIISIIRKLISHIYTLPNIELVYHIDIYLCIADMYMYTYLYVKTERNS